MYYLGINSIRALQTLTKGQTWKVIDENDSRIIYQRISMINIEQYVNYCYNITFYHNYIIIF